MTEYDYFILYLDLRFSRAVLLRTQALWNVTLITGRAIPDVSKKHLSFLLSFFLDCSTYVDEGTTFL